MSQFGDSEASVSSDEEVMRDSRIPRREDSVSSEDSEEEEEIPDEDEICRKEGQGWIVNDDEDEDAGEGSDNESETSEKSAKDDVGDDDDDDALDDDDYLLIRENIGIDVKRRAKKRRLVVDDDDEGDTEMAGSSKKVRGRETIARELFEDGEDDESVVEGDSRQRDSGRHATNYAVRGVDEDDEGEESDGMEGFIVDDADAEGRGARRKRQILHQDPSLQKAQNIFGVDFDFEEFEQFGDRHSEASEESEYDDYYEDDEVQEHHRKDRRDVGAAAEDRVYELFDPEDLARNFYGAEHERIRCLDVPERLQLRSVPVKQIDPTSDSYQDDLNELKKEAEWIYNHLFSEGPMRLPPSSTEYIFQVLKLIKESLAEVPFIAFYRKEFFGKTFNINDLWNIYEYDEKWELLQQRRNSLLKQIERMYKYQTSLKNDGACDNLARLITLAKNAASTEEVQDVRQNYLLHYGDHTAAMLIFEGRDVGLDKSTFEDEGKKKKKKVKKQSSKQGDGEDEEDDEEEEEDEEDEDYDPDRDMKNLSVQEGGDGGEKPEGGSSSEDAAAKSLKVEGAITITKDRISGRRIRQRQVRAPTTYALAERAGIAGLVAKFGLSSREFAENVSNGYQRQQVRECPLSPLEAAREFLSPQISTPEMALTAARYMLAYQMFCEPEVRQLARLSIPSQTVVNIRPTPKGLCVIDKSHPLAPFKYIKNKPALDLMGDVTYLHIENARKNGLINVELVVPQSRERHGLSLINDLEQCFRQEGFSALVQEWNEQRKQALRSAIDDLLQPLVFKELQAKLLEASQRAVVKSCAQKLFHYIKVAPYIVDDRYDGGSPSGGQYYGGGGDRSEDDDDDDEGGSDASSRGSGPNSRRNRRNRHRDSRRHRDTGVVDSGGGGGGGGGGHLGHSVWPKPARLLAFAVREDLEVAHCMVCMVQLDADGEVVDHANLPGLLFSSRTTREDARKRREADIKRLAQFLKHTEPQAIVVGCNSRRSLILRDEIQRQAEAVNLRPSIVLMETELAEVYARSDVASAGGGKGLSALHKEAVSLGRRLQDPLAEFAQLYNVPDTEILGVRWHPAQDEVPREMLLRALEIEFINRTNEVGVDVNRCLQHPHTANLLQFVAGLGPRKAAHMLKILRHRKTFLTNRELLAKLLHLGPRVAINCAGFIKIDTTSARDLPGGGGDNIEILDSTRVHPESYDLARQMAVDALEYDDSEDNDPAGALEEIIQCPNRLRELDLDAFAEELKRQEHGDKRVTLYDIRKELNQRYRDLRDPFEPLTNEQIFSLATHETPETLHTGCLVDCRVVDVVSKRPSKEQQHQTNPTKNEATGLWRCSFCRRDDFRQLKEIWLHLDNEECPGRVVGLRVQLDNGITGFIPCRFMDEPVEKVLENAKPGSILQARVLKIDITKFSVELTLQAAEIQAELRHLAKTPRDSFFDFEAEEAEAKRQDEEEKRRRMKANEAYTQRVIFHPHFRNITYNQLVGMNDQLEVGAVVIRPSRKGTDHLTVSLKIDDGIFRHFDVLERDKEQSFALGKTLVLGGEAFEDLDEIVARYMEPMVALLRDIYGFKYYVNSGGGERDVLKAHLREEKAASGGKRIPYALSSCADRPGYFYLAYLPAATPRFEFFSVRPEGLKFRGRIFPSLDALIGWFKLHYNEIPRVSNSHQRIGDDIGAYAPGGGLGETTTTTATGHTRTPRMDEFFSLPIPYSGEQSQQH